MATAVESDKFGFRLYGANDNDLAQAEEIHFEEAAPQGSQSGAVYSYIDTARHFLMAPYGGTLLLATSSVSCESKSPAWTICVVARWAGRAVRLLVASGTLGRLVASMY